MTDNIAQQALPRVAVLGGTGKEGSGLALRWAHAGYHVVIGSRHVDRAQATATQINDTLDCHRSSGSDNLAAAQGADIAVLAVPYSAQLGALAEIKDALQGKILVDVTVPLVPPRVGTVQLPACGSAVVAAQQFLGEGVRVVSAFQNVSAEHLNHIGAPIDCDVLVCGDDRAAREAVIALARAAGMRAFHAGPLANSAAAEALTSILITINQHYKIKHSGIRITGLPDDVGGMLG